MTAADLGGDVAAAFTARQANDIPGAIAIYRRMLRKAPENPSLHYGLGQLLLLSGHLPAGWEECEWREQRSISLPRWRGAPLEGARILLHGEQGYGDNIQFVRYAPLVAARGGTVVVATQRGLRPLLATVPGVSEVVEEGESTAQVRCHIPMLSLPYLLGTRLDSIPNTVPYISADPQRIDAWRRRLEAYPAPRVGLVWSGNTAAVYNAHRSPGLAGVRPLLDCPGVTFFSLQKGGGRKDLEGAALPDHFIDLDDALVDFSETAAAMMALDLVITPCTSTAHLAGALARPVWIMLSTSADWRWLLNRDDSPWYPTARLFRQSAFGEWGAPIARIRSELDTFALTATSAA